jgi:D-alanine-D-alanine ligase
MSVNKKQRIAVLKGGISAEREVSLESGKAVACGLRTAGHDVVEVDVISRDFTVPTDADVVFIALHGEFGEDGGVQTRLEQLQLPYVGAGVEASQVAFDKILSENALREAGIPVPESEVLRDAADRTLSLPVAVKPPRQGSSVGCHLVFEEATWETAFADAKRYDDEVLVQRYIPGREFTVGVVDGEVLPIVEIITAGGWYDYSAKYEVETTRYEVPARLEDSQAAAMCRLTLETFHALNCRGFGRVDFRMTDAGELFVLELNTIPGFTSHSLLPKAAAVAGIEFPSLCDRIVQTASL